MLEWSEGSHPFGLFIALFLSTGSNKEGSDLESSWGRTRRRINHIWKRSAWTAALVPGEHPHGLGRWCCTKSNPLFLFYFLLYFVISMSDKRFCTPTVPLSLLLPSLVLLCILLDLRHRWWMLRLRPLFLGCVGSAGCLCEIRGIELLQRTESQPGQHRPFCLPCFSLSEGRMCEWVEYRNTRAYDVRVRRPQHFEQRQRQTSD